MILEHAFNSTNSDSLAEKTIISYFSQSFQMDVSLYHEDKV